MTTGNTGGSLDDQRKAATGIHHVAGKKRGSRSIGAVPAETARERMARVVASRKGRGR